MRARIIILVMLVATGLVAFYLLMQPQSTTVNRASIREPEISAPSEQTPPLRRPREELTPAVLPTAPPNDSERKLPGKIFGRVYSGEGYPAQSAAISATWVPSDGGTAIALDPVETATDEDGAFVLENLPLGWHLVLARQNEAAARERCLLLAHASVTEVVLVLKPRHIIAGNVVNPDREAVPMAALYPVLNDGKPVGQENSAGFVVHADDNGDFQFDAPDPGDWQFLVIAADYAPTLSPPIATGTEDARIELVKGVSVSGRVVEDSTNAPVAGVTVELTRDKIPGPPFTVESEVDGGFAFGAVAPGDYSIEVQAATQTLPEVPVHVAVAYAPVSNLVLRLVTGGAVRGTVLVDETQTPLAGIVVHARRTGPAPLRYAASPSGLEGEFEVAGLPPGEYVFYTRRPPGFATVGRSKDEVTVQLQPGQIVDGVTLALKQGLTITGQVVDTSGNPVAGADVRGRGEGWQDQQTSDAGGFFMLANLRPGVEVTIGAATSMAASGLMGPMAVPDSGLSNLQLVLTEPRNALIAGIVVDRQSRPLTVKVIAWPDGGPVVTVPPMDDSDASGRFVLPNVAPGAYAITVKPGQGEQHEAARLRLEPGQQLRDVRLVYPEDASLSIAGRIVGLDGTGVACSLTLYRQEAANSIHQAMTNTTVEGDFRFDGLASGSYAIEVRESPGYQGGHLYDIEAGSEDLEIVLEPAPRMSGRVIDATGKPVTNFEIALVDSGALPSSSTIRRREFQAVSHPEGEFEFDVASGWYEILVRSEGRETQHFTVGAISAEQPAHDLEIVLP